STAPTQRRPRRRSDGEAQAIYNSRLTIHKASQSNDPATINAETAEIAEKYPLGNFSELCVERCGDFSATRPPPHTPARRVAPAQRDMRPHRGLARTPYRSDAPRGSHRPGAGRLEPLDPRARPRCRLS